jgi:hypothetical protein
MRELKTKLKNGMNGILKPFEPFKPIDPIENLERINLIKESIAEFPYPNKPMELDITLP